MNLQTSEKVALKPSSKPVLPVVAGDWVASLEGHTFQVGRVKDAYFDKDGEVIIDLVLYGMDGDKIGRTSPAMGGPRSFEPSLEYAGSWRRIDKPVFPLLRRSYTVPVPGKPGSSYLQYDAHVSVRPKPERVTAIDRRRPRAAASLPAGNLPGVERASLMRSAQELRDAARKIDDIHAKASLKKRAGELEAEAELLR